MGRRAQRIKDKGIHSEYDPNMNKLFKRDIAREKEEFEKFAKEVRLKYPHATPIKRMVAPENCQECEVRPWEYQSLVSTAINTVLIMKFCGVCQPKAYEMCQKYGHRMKVMIHRPHGYYPLEGMPMADGYIDKYDGTFRYRDHDNP